MAQFKLTNFIDVGCHGYHTATSWKVTLDQPGQQIIDKSLVDHSNLTTWQSPLPDGNGGYYSDLDKVHLWVRVHILGTASPWFYAGWANQNDQTFHVTKNGTIQQTINSIIAGIH